MQHSARSDPELLAEWLESGSEPAFHALVDRYAGLVLMTATRICGDRSLAAEASQLTFILLARKAKALTACPSLGGWVHRAAIMHSRNLLRSSRREEHKRNRLQVAIGHAATDQPAGIWKEMQPVLDQALAALSDNDREALLLRFYRSLSIRETAETLGIATTAAQKRIDRATERLRSQLARRGCQAGGTLATVMLAGFAADVKAAAPAVSLFTSNALAAATAGAGVISTTTVTTVLTAAAMKASSFIVPSIAVLATAWVAIQHHSISGLEQQNAKLKKDISSGAGFESPGSPQSRTKTANSRNAAAKDQDAWQRLAPGPQRMAAVTDKARTILFEKNPARRLRLFSKFIGDFDPGDFEAIATSFMEHDQQGRLFAEEYELFLSTAAMVDGNAAMRNIFKEDADLSRSPFGAQHSAMVAWAVEDPQQAAEWWNKLPESTVKTELARSLISGIASSDIEYAWQCLHEFPEAQRGQFMSSMIQQQITDKGADAAAGWMDSLQAPDGSDLGALKHQGFQTLLGTLVNLTPSKKSEFINRFADEDWMQKSSFPAGVAVQWATSNGSEAVAWADSLSGDARLNAMLSALGTWQQRNAAEYETWKAAHIEDPVFQGPIQVFEEFRRAQATGQ